MPRYQVAFVGNHQPDIPAQNRFATEYELALALESLGWQVIKLQEDRATTEQILEAGMRSDFVFFTKTWGWTTPGRMTMDQLVEILRQNGKPTVSYTLDRIVGIADREAMVGRHPFFKTDFLFSADGGNQEFFESRGVRHYWAPPAVGDRHCWLAQPESQYKCDVCFVGSKVYHDSIYPFRRQLVDWLDQIDAHPYTVRRWGGDRVGARAELNAIYASAKVIVGDSIFAGVAPKYYSDRVTETQGRGGFLLHPPIEGSNLTGIGGYKPGDLADLDAVIQYYLAHDEERERMRLAGFEWVKQWHTCSQRVIEILNRVSADTGVRLN